MKTTITLIALLCAFTTLSQAAVVKGFDPIASCDLYRIAEADANGSIKMDANETIIYGKTAYGFSFSNMEIKFDLREVSIVPMINVTLGINRPLFDSKMTIEAQNPDFNFLINQLNRKVSLFEKICTRDQKIIYANFFETH